MVASGSSSRRRSVFPSVALFGGEHIASGVSNVRCCCGCLRGFFFFCHSRHYSRYIFCCLFPLALRRLVPHVQQTLSVLASVHTRTSGSHPAHIKRCTEREESRMTLKKGETYAALGGHVLLSGGVSAICCGVVVYPRFFVLHTRTQIRV